jgi:hypothetical protein
MFARKLIDMPTLARAALAATAAAAIATGSALPHAQAAPPPDPGINATITAQDSTTVRTGGPPMHFTVTLDNEGPDVARVGLVVSLGHCSCGAPGASMMAKGTMQRFDPATNVWVKAPYVRQGTGMDFITANVVAPFPLAHGQTVSYQLEMQLDPEQVGVTDGQGGVEVTLADPDDPMEGDRLGKGAFLPITVDA